MVSILILLQSFLIFLNLTSAHTKPWPFGRSMYWTDFSTYLMHYYWSLPFTKHREIETLYLLIYQSRLFHSLSSLRSFPGLWSYKNIFILFYFVLFWALAVCVITMMIKYSDYVCINLQDKWGNTKDAVFLYFLCLNFNLLAKSYSFLCHILKEHIDLMEIFLNYNFKCN